MEKIGGLFNSFMPVVLEPKRARTILVISFEPKYFWENIQRRNDDQNPVYNSPSNIMGVYD